MPQDDVQPCPHCGGTGEVRGETLAATVATEPQPPFRVTATRRAYNGDLPGHSGPYDSLREARRNVYIWSKEHADWRFIITDANGNIIPNNTGCSICNDPNCDNPSGKH